MVIHKAKISKPQIGIGCQITLKGIEAEITLMVELARTMELVPKGVPKISLNSPLGRALIGQRAGDEIMVQTPSGEIRFRIVNVVPLCETSK